MRILLADILTEEPGLPDIHTVRSAREAVDACSREPVPALVLLDMTMPGLSPLAAAATIKRRHPKLPIIAMSATVGTAAGALAAGCADFIAKPFNADDLVQLMTRWLRDGHNLS